MILSSRPLRSAISCNFIMGCKHLHKSPPVRPIFPSFLPNYQVPTIVFHHFHHHSGIFYSNSTKPMFQIHHFGLKKSGVFSITPIMAARSVHLVQSEGEKVEVDRLPVLREKLEREGIYCDDSCSPGEYHRMLCPQCEGGDSMERSFSLYIREDGDLAIWNCFRAKCGWRGHVRASIDAKGYSESDRSSKVKFKRVLKEENLNLEPLCDELIKYFAVRKISSETLRRNGVMQRQLGHKNQVVIAFTYRKDGKIVNCKYRDVAKNFSQEKDTERIFYGVDDIKQATDIIIVEGEMDKLSMEEAGYQNCVSVPDGAPSMVSDKALPSIEKDTKYKYLWDCKGYLDKASRIILATDADAPGQALAEELARRLGRERCWRVRWPMKSSTEVCKDANEVLMHLGPEVLMEVIENAELYPIRGLFCFRDFFDEIDEYYNLILGNEMGVSTGWRSLEGLYKVVPGELTIVSGVPNSGKSEWIDALICNINERQGWTFALCSMENKVREHARKLLEKHIKKPFFNTGYCRSVLRMSPEELVMGKQWLDDTFVLIRCDDDCLPSIKWVLDLARAAVLRHGVRGLVIDPYNELDHQRSPSQTETEYVSQMLTQVKRFAQHHACHVWFVAHPRQLQNWNGGPPNLYDISGSAHFINKCDNGIIIHRNRDLETGPLDQVQVCVRKVRNKVAGTIGDAYLSYNRITGEFSDIDRDIKATNTVPRKS